jgi:hypothetical protein
MNVPCLVFFGIATAIPLSAQIQDQANMRAFRPTGITGAPYSATQTTEHIQTLSDGTHITQPVQKSLMYRDSAGRTRSEFTNPGSPRSDQPTTVMVFIIDPVAGFRYQLNSTDKVAQKFAMPAVRPTTAQPAVSTMASTPSVGGLIVAGSGKIFAPVTATGNGPVGNSPKATSESLGLQLIEGVTAEGTRTTTSWPVGSVGNDREIIATSETWFSKQLGVAVLTKSSDPRSGDITMKLTDISLAEPDSALFMPPADYTVKEMGGPAGSLIRP